MNLKQGILSIHGSDIHSRTSIQELKKICDPAIITEDNHTHTGSIHCKRLSIVGETLFLCEFYFSNNHIDTVIMKPALFYPKELVEKKEKEQFRRKFCEHWLRQNLGAPDLSKEEETAYHFPWGKIGAISHLDPRSAYDGGYICLRYLR